MEQSMPIRSYCAMMKSPFSSSPTQATVAVLIDRTAGYVERGEPKKDCIKRWHERLFLTIVESREIDYQVNFGASQ